MPSTSVSELVIPKSVKQISGYIDKTSNSSNATPTGAFEDQTTLTSIRFEGSNVQIIGNQAFKGCTSLTTVKLPSSVTTIGNNAFENTGAIAQINLDNVKLIGNSAFKQAFTNLPANTVELNLSNAQFIDTMAFMNNSAIKAVNFNNNKTLRSIGTSAFESSAVPGTINLSKATYLKSIGQSAFKSTTKLDNVTLPSSLTTLGSNTASVGVFQNSSVSSVDLSNTNLTTLNQSTFDGATNLTTVKLPDSLTTIEVSAFSNTGITSLDLSNTKITTLQNNSFMGLANITEVKLPDTLTTLGESTFKNSSLQTIDLSNTKITTLPNDTFNGATKLSSVKLPAGLTSIGNDVFKATASLTEIDLTKNALTSIGSSAFEASGITSITLPASTGDTIMTINQNAFKGSNISFADFRNTNLSTLPASIFENCANLEYLLVKSPDVSQANNNNATAVQKQITTVGNAAFKNARKLKSIFHVTNDNTNTQ